MRGLLFDSTRYRLLETRFSKELILVAGFFQAPLSLMMQKENPICIFEAFLHFHHHSPSFLLLCEKRLLVENKLGTIMVAPGKWLLTKELLFFASRALGIQSCLISL